MGFFWQVLIIFGLHWSAVPVAMINLQLMGYDTLLLVTHPAAFAQTAALIAMCIKLKNKKQKMMAVPAIISGLMGVTEPSIYGYTLPAKWPFIASMIGAAVGNGLMSMFGVKRYIMGAGGIPGMVNYISPDGDVSGVIMAAICILVAMIIAFILTLIMWKDKEDSVQETTPLIQKGDDMIAAPMKGNVIALNEVKDEVFSSGAMGDGVAIEPSEGSVFAPVSGTISTLFPTYHAIGITSDQGVEVLIHVGMDTVGLQGKGFVPKIAQGDHVEKGQLLMDVDLDILKQAGLSTITPVIITNTNDCALIEKLEVTTVASGDPLMKVTK